MSNVVPLFKQETIDKHPSDDPSNRVTIAIANILASCVQLSHTIRKLSNHIAAADHVIDGLDDAESKNRRDQLMEMRSKALAAAMHELSQAIRKLPSLLTIWPKVQNVLFLSRTRRSVHRHVH